MLELNFGPIPTWVLVVVALLLLDRLVVSVIDRFKKPPNVNPDPDPTQTKRPRVMPPPPPWSHKR